MGVEIENCSEKFRKKIESLVEILGRNFWNFERNPVFSKKNWFNFYVTLFSRRVWPTNLDLEVKVH